MPQRDLGLLLPFLSWWFFLDANISVLWVLFFSAWQIYLYYSRLYSLFIKQRLTCLSIQSSWGQWKAEVFKRQLTSAIFRVSKISFLRFLLYPPKKATVFFSLASNLIIRYNTSLIPLADLDSSLVKINESSAKIKWSNLKFLHLGCHLNSSEFAFFLSRPEKASTPKTKR